MDIVTLNRRRGGMKAQITKISNISSEELKNMDKLDVKNKIETLEKLENRLDELRVEYYKVIKDEEMEDCDLQFEDLDGELQKQKVRLKNCFELKQTKTVKQVNIETDNSESNRKLNIKLPEITLPKFDGNYENWNSFITQFNSIIVSNEMLSDSQKLFYLQSSLVGNANQIQSIDDTFESLLTALKNRYDNKRLIVNSHMNSLLGLENITFESAEKLRKFVDCVLKHVRALKVMKIEMNNFSENLLINLLLQKLDRVTRKEYEMTLISSELPDWKKFISFLEERCQILENLQKGGCVGKIKLPHFQNKVKNFVVNSRNSMCNLCKTSSHGLYKCDLFLKMNPIQRFDFVKRHKLCLNCLSQSHQLINCNSKYVCKFCKSKGHNYLLHRTQNNFSEENASDTVATLNGTQNAESSFPLNETGVKGNDLAEASATLSSCFAAKRKNVLLATAEINVRNKNGSWIKGRAILDSGSQICAISKPFANILGLKQKRTNTLVSSLAGKSISIKGETTAIISNFDETFTASVDFLILPKITDLMPASEIDISHLRIPQNVILADSNFYKSNRLDILIGGEIFFDLLKAKTIRINDSLIMKETVFGYIVCGTVKGSSESKHCGFISQLDELEQNVKQFWNLENMDDSPSLRDEEIECEKLFCESSCRDKITGKYTVNLPVKENLNLGDSKKLAETRLENLWKRLDKNPEMKRLYTDFMNEYQTLGHMQEVAFTENVKQYIMPHHGVFRADSTTTKLRVVFDASAPSSNGVSLNNCLLKGGVVQEDLFSILLRFRKHKIAFVADIQKMYRQIWINPEQRNLQCILWKNNSKEEARLFQLNTVTYGTTCAPFLATRALKQLTLDERDNYPLASDAALSDFYVDDILTGAEDIATALELQHQLIKMLNSGGMVLHKWCSNEQQLLDRVSVNHKEYDFVETNNNTVKTLGLRWEPKEENFYFNVSSGSGSPTKRSVLSEIARLFDPLGLLGPVITQAKIFMQQLWKIKIDWNDELPKEEKNKWENFRRNLLELKKIKIPRYVFLDYITSVELHGFSDAAKEAYGAVVYLRCMNSKRDIKVSLLCSKSRIAPIRETTIPRLELCGAVLLAKLVKKVTEALRVKIDEVFLYTDSKIVLAWIPKAPAQLKLFVKNRVAIIQELTELKCWRHVSSNENPADVLSRGVEANKIDRCKIWWHGPSFLHKEMEFESSNSEPLEETELYLRELKDVSSELSALVQKPETLDIINNCSSYFKLLRVVAYCLRFIKIARRSKVIGCLSSDELSQALVCIVKNVQATAFSEEIQLLKKDKPLPHSSNLLNLCPFLDSQEILRVGGRLKNSPLGLQQKHPILLPNNHNFAYLVINHFHLLYFHLGAEGTLSFIRTKFWIVSARNIVRRLINQCIICRKVSAKGSQQLMADLPAARITPTRVFDKIGVDFAGPFIIKTFSGKNKNFNKCFVCIFICFAVKAVHFEIVHSLTTEAFLSALKRFVSRRGKPSEICSDNGTNFVGANNELRKIVKDLFKGNKEKIEDYLAREGIKWSFNPPAAPHFGGLWEAGIKSLKYHLKRVIGNTILSHEEFLTLVTQIEAVLNSRPLCPLSNDPNDISVLTPAHFLVGSSLVALPDPDYLEIPMNKLNRWQLVQKFTQIIWKRWSNEYLNRLQQRPKWSRGVVKFKEGDVVLVKNSNDSGYLKWHLAKIVKTHQGKDNIIRVVTIKDKNGTYQRPVTKIAALPFVN